VRSGRAIFAGITLVAWSHVRLFSVGRSPAEIAGDMSAELSPASAAFTSLVGYWRFDENGGVVAHDDKGSYDGTLMRLPLWVPSTAF
jgi:hypothetical protein